MFKTGAHRQRTGLAPLELVIVLPLLLFLCAIIINIGTAALWRVRGEVTSRDVIWRSRSGRSGQLEAAPPAWPKDALLRIEESGPINELAVLLNSPVVHGPLPNGFSVGDALDGRHGSREGISKVERRYPLLTRLGRYQSGDIENPLFDYKWPCAEMWFMNVSRRSLALYKFPVTDQRLPLSVTHAGEAMLAMPNWLDLEPLDHDEDLYRYRGYYPDFHPRIRHPYVFGGVDVKYCQTDREVVHDEQVVRLVDTLNERQEAELHEISRLPRLMTNTFLRQYESAISSHQGQIEGWRREIERLSRPPEGEEIDRAAIAQLQASIQESQAEINRLSPFAESLKIYQAKLPEIEKELAERFEAMAAAKMMEMME